MKNMSDVLGDTIKGKLDTKKSADAKKPAEDYTLEEQDAIYTLEEQDAILLASVKSGKRRFSEEEVRQVIGTFGKLNPVIALRYRQSFMQNVRELGFDVELVTYKTTGTFFCLKRY